MVVSGTLSRYHLSYSEPEFTENSLIHIMYILYYRTKLPISETHFKQFQLETKNKHILQIMITYTAHEWTEKHLISTDIHLYYTHRSDINLCEGTILINKRIMITTTLRAEMQSLIHQRYRGIKTGTFLSSFFCMYMAFVVVIYFSILFG